MNKEPNLRIFFEEGEPTREESIKCFLELMSVMLEGYQEMIDRNVELDEDIKKKVNSTMPLLPTIKKIVSGSKNTDND